MTLTRWNWTGKSEGPFIRRQLKASSPVLTCSMTFGMSCTDKNSITVLIAGAGTRSIDVGVGNAQSVKNALEKQWKSTDPAARIDGDSGVPML